MFSRDEPPQSVSQRVSAIEAWLDNQPDPFIDNHPGLLEKPAPLKIKRKRRSERLSTESTGVDKAHKSVEGEQWKSAQSSSTKGRKKGRRSRSSHDKKTPPPARNIDAPQTTGQVPKLSPRSADKNQGCRDESSSGLKRRGARALRGRRGSSPVKQTVHKDEATWGDRQAPPFPPHSGTYAALPEREKSKGNPKIANDYPARNYHPLSTIASVETFQPHTNKEKDADTAVQEAKGLQRRLTTHEDLMSVLSLPRTGGSIKPARSVRTSIPRMSAASLAEVYGELAAGEDKYMRELKTLVDGVIPVLLQCVLSKSDSAAAAGLFSSSASARDDLNFTRPIVDMGVALERLKTLHRRIPTQDDKSLLIWAHSAHKVYVEYLKAWRLGFQDVVVNLAPPDEHTQAEIDQGMARDQDGDVINSKGEKVDVAYLLKRPLVRIKNLARVFSRLKVIKPSVRASTVAEQYEELIKTARRRSHEEESRLEDEAAANIDATKARDPHSLAALTGVAIDKSRRVRAGDCFGLTIHHSSGQRVDCEVELLLRDNLAADGGDLLICEMENNGRWLLFPPIEMGFLSARCGDGSGEIVVMIREPATDMGDRHELLLLKTDDNDAASEWVNMLGSQPLPPKLTRVSSFGHRRYTGSAPLIQDCANEAGQLPSIPQPPHTKEVEIPLGEPSLLGRRRERRSKPMSTIQREVKSSELPLDIACQEVLQVEEKTAREAKVRPISILPSQHERSASIEPLLSSTSPTTLKRSGLAKRRPLRRGQSASNSAQIPSSPSPAIQTAPSTPIRQLSRTDSALREWASSSDPRHSQISGTAARQKAELPLRSTEPTTLRPEYRRTRSSTPSKELPVIPRLRPGQSANKSRFESIRERWSTRPSEEKQANHDKLQPKTESTPKKDADRPIPPSTPVAEEDPVHSTHRPRSLSPSSPTPEENRPAPPLHRLPLQQETAKVELISKPQPQFAPSPTRRHDRRSSSPLKHQYAPSIVSVSDEASDSEESIASSTSGTSEDYVAELGKQPSALLSNRTMALKETAKAAPPATLSNLPAETLAPSNSASQAPYRTVPHLNQHSGGPMARKIATVCAWSDKGAWESVHPDECSIMVSPGLIEAYEMSAAHGGTPTRNEDGTIADGSSCEDNQVRHAQPLVGFELTPLVPLRRGTALDISIRSPPTRESKIKTSTNIMFRCRNAQECEELYAVINYARINNPTWIALEQARPKEVPTVSFETGRGSARHSRAGSKSSPWFGLGNMGRKSSYRAPSTPRAGASSIGGASESSVASMSSALSALRRFSGGASDGKKRFNLHRSSVLRKHGRFGGGGITSLYSSSSNTTKTGGSGSGVSSPSPSHLALAGAAADDTSAIPASMAPAGTLNNVKVRLYIRESASRWREMGSGRLCVMSSTPAGVMADTNVNIGDERRPPPPSTTPMTDSPNPSSPSLAASQRPTTSTFGQSTPSSAPLPPPPRLSSSNHTPHRVHGNGNEKRILITGKSKGQTLLDATLHESCFERIARTGIAISVWQERVEVAKVGGVVGGKATTYMMQMRGEAEASWVFGLVGRLRY